MRIGILETDTLEPDIKKKHGSYAEMFQGLFLSVDSQLEFNVYCVIEGHYPENMDECDAYLITGSQFSAYDNVQWVTKLRSYIVDLHNHRKKLIGICFGHQIIAHALGGLTEKSKNGWGVGNFITDIKIQKPWMNQAGKQFFLLVSHQDQVIKLPDHSELIASNDFCPNAAFQMDKHILTFQGHPEFSEDYLKYLMNKRKDKIGEERYSKAMDSLKQENNGQVVAKWIIDFISGD